MFRADPKTIQWVWKSSFADWASEPGGLFWICGKPASGKSTLMETIARSDKLKEHLRRSSSENWTVVHHFFFDFGVSKDLRNNFEGFLRSLLSQLIKVGGNLGAEDPSDSEPENRWSMRALQERLTIVLKQLSNPICVLVDGLDEYQDNKWDLAEFLRGKASSRVKICVASRPDRVFENAFMGLPTIKMQDWNTPAIDTMVTLTIQRSVAGSNFYSDSQVVELAKGISEKAQGVFLWARFAVNELRDGWSAGLDLAELQMRLDKVPIELEDIYARIFKKVKPEQCQEAAFLLQLVCYAKRTLTLEELYVATAHAANGQGPFAKEITVFAIQRFEKRILAATGGLLEVFQSRKSYKSQESDKLSVNVIHRTVRTYLDSNGWLQLLGAAHEGMLHAEVLWLRVCAGLFPPSFTKIPSFQGERFFYGHELMVGRARAALDPKIPSSSDAQLSSTRPVDLDQCSDANAELSPLLEYAAMFMLDHAAEVEHGLDLTSFDMLQPGMSNSFMCYHRFYCADPHQGACVCFVDLCPEPLHPLHLAILHGLDTYVKDFLSTLYNNNGPGSREWDDVFDVEIYGGGTFSREKRSGSLRVTLLDYAIRTTITISRIPGSHIRILSTLMDHYSRPHDAELITALQHSTAEVVKLLLCHWPDGKMILKSNFRSDEDLEEESSYNDFWEFCPESLAVGPMWYIARRHGIEDLRAVEELIDLFLQRGENINDQCGPFGTALHGVLLQLNAWDSWDRIELLVTKGADVNASGPFGTPLEFVWRLANTVNDFDFGDAFPWTSTIEWLVDNGAVNNRCDPNGSVPSRERMLSFGTSGIDGVWESRRFYRGDPIGYETSGDGIDAEV